MSVIKRFINLGKSELNSLLDKASSLADGDGDDDDGTPARARRRAGAAEVDGRDGWSELENLTDDQLWAELERRRQAREGGGDPGKPPADGGSRRSGAASGAGGAASSGRAGGGAGSRSSSAGRAEPRSSAGEVAKAYAMLEVPQGADFETVRKSYRDLMRKYHPDRHTESPEKQKAANEVAQRLTGAYKLLEKRLRR